MATLARHVERGRGEGGSLIEPVRKYWAKCLPWPPIRAARLFPEPAAGEPYYTNHGRDD
jgi:hypothetical protein